MTEEQIELWRKMERQANMQIACSIAILILSILTLAMM